METKVIKAVFIGHDGSLGYSRGKEYLLIIHQKKSNGNICIMRKETKDGECEYSSLVNFLNNWDNINSIK